MTMTAKSFTDGSHKHKHYEGEGGNLNSYTLMIATAARTTLQK